MSNYVQNYVYKKSKPDVSCGMISKNLIMLQFSPNTRFFHFITQTHIHTHTHIHTVCENMFVCDKHRHKLAHPHRNNHTKTSIHFLPRDTDRYTNKIPHID